LSLRCDLPGDQSVDGTAEYRVPDTSSSAKTGFSEVIQRLGG
jgi:hypothetical protein